MERYRPRLLLAPALLFAIAAAVAGTTVALASVGHSGPVTVASNATGTATATCPNATRAISGGFAAPGFNKNTSIAVRVSSKRVGRRGWAVTAASLGSDPGKIEAFSYCTHDALHIARVASRVAVPQASAGTVTAVCPHGSKAVSGGFATPGFSATGGSQVIVATSRRVGQRRWRVVGFNASSDPGTGTLVGYAYCERGAPRLETRSVTQQVSPTQILSFDTACPAGARAISGGFDGHFVGGADPNAGPAVDSFRSQHGAAWRTTAVSAGDQSGTATGYAYCLKHSH